MCSTFRNYFVVRKRRTSVFQDTNFIPSLVNELLKNVAIMHKCIYWFKFQKCQKNFIMGLKDTVLIYMYPKFHACSINRSISIEFLNKLCSGVKFTFCAHMKQILLSNVLFHCCNILLIQISNISYSPRIVCTKISL